MDEKVKVARLSIASGVILTTGKLAAGLFMNSMSVISDAAHSGIDLIAAIVAYFSVRESGRPADAIHRYGHGKFENLASIIEALLIVSAAVFIIIQSIPKLFSHAEIHAFGLGTIIMGTSATVNFLVSQILMNTARRTGSPALAADAWHLRTDVYSSLGVLTGLVLIRLTGLYILDPLIAIGLTLLILKAAWSLLRESLGSILDVSLSNEEEEIVKEVLRKCGNDFINFHELRTRQGGSQRYVDLHLVVPGKRFIADAHALCDLIEEEIQRKLPRTQVLIHLEPCTPACDNCCFDERTGEHSGSCNPECINRINH